MPIASQMEAASSTSPTGTLWRASVSILMTRMVPGGRSGALGPARQVVLLFGRQGVDPHRHRFQLEPGDLAIDLRGNAVNLPRERRSFAGDVLACESLVREGHVHHAGRVAFRSGQVHEAPFTEK